MAQSVYDHSGHHAAGKAADTAGDRLFRADRGAEFRPADRAPDKQRHHVPEKRYRESQAQQDYFHRLLVRNQAQCHQAQPGQRNRQQRKRAHAQVRQFRLLPEQDLRDQDKQRDNQQRHDDHHTEKLCQRQGYRQDHPRRPGHNPVSRGHQRVILFPHREPDADQCCQRHAPVWQPQADRQERAQSQSRDNPLFHSYILSNYTVSVMMNVNDEVLHLPPNLLCRCANASSASS